jgi:DNA-directed RNA polymerase subunit RPC12/RpoP
MANHDSDQVQMQIECSECHKKMLVQVGLSPETANNTVECPNCHHRIISLVPGPIVGGPFSVDAWVRPYAWYMRPVR